MLCEVHDENGCICTMSNVEAGKQTALDHLTFRPGARLHIEIWPESLLAAQQGMVAIRLDPETRAWSQPSNALSVSHGLADRHRVDANQKGYSHDDDRSRPTR